MVNQNDNLVVLRIGKQFLSKKDFQLVYRVKSKYDAWFQEHLKTNIGET